MPPWNHSASCWVGFHPLDTMVGNGEFAPLLRYKRPFALGHDVSGVVTEVGAGVRDFAVGDEIYARSRDLRIGTFAEFIAVGAADVALKPNSLSFEQAAQSSSWRSPTPRPTSPRSSPATT